MEHFSTRKKIIYIFILIIFLFIFINQLVMYEQWHRNKSLAFSSQFKYVEGWEHNISRNTDSYVAPDNLTMLTKPVNFCSTPMFLLIIVCSAPKNFEARNVIRETWASNENLLGLSTKIYFLVGETENSIHEEHIHNESQEYHDILQDRFIDTYNNLTLKSIMMLKIVNSYCVKQIRFLMKTDDDMYINLPPLLKMLHRRNSTKDVLLGCLICGARPIQDTSNKWYAPKYMYSQKTYPNYLSGTGYVMSVDVVPRLYRAARKTPIFHLEDVYITGILSKSINLRPHNDPGFTYIERELNPCLYTQAYTSHHITSMEMHHLYANIKTINFDVDCKQKPSKQKTKVSKIVNYLYNKNGGRSKKNSCS